MFKRNKFFSYKTSSFFLEPFTLEQKVISWHILTEDLIAKHKSK